MGRSEREYGTVPPARRKLFAGSVAAAGIVVIVVGLLINWFTHSDVAWGWLAVAAGFVMGMYSIYLWIRLSD